MTTATAKFTEQCPDCGRNLTGKSPAGAKNKVTAHQKRLHLSPESAAVTPAIAEQGEDGAAVLTDPVLPPGPHVFDSGFGPIEGGSDPEPPPIETASPTLDTTVLLDGLYAHDKRGVLAWIHTKYPKVINLMRDMNSVGLG